MHDLVVGQRQDIVFMIGIVHAECHVVVVMLPMNRFLAHVTKGVMHPPHLPFHGKAKPAHIGRP